MDAVITLAETPQGPIARCQLMRDLQVGDAVLVGKAGVKTQALEVKQASSEFQFMSSQVSSERRVEHWVKIIADQMRQIRDRKGKIVVVAGPVVIHTGGGDYLAQLIRQGYVQALLGGNAIAVHDLEQSMFGTSLGLHLDRGHSVSGGHTHHLQVINQIRRSGSIAKAVEQGLITQGVFYECIQQGIPFSLAGSIRDDGPLPDTQMDLIVAQEDYAKLLQGADMILMLSSMLHSIAVGNMTPAGVKLVAVDINPAVLTKLSDRGSTEAIGIVTDVGLFLSSLTHQLNSL